MTLAPQPAPAAQSPRLSAATRVGAVELTVARLERSIVIIDHGEGTR